MYIRPSYCYLSLIALWMKLVDTNQFTHAAQVYTLAVKFRDEITNEG